MQHWGETQPLLSWQWIRAGPTGSTDFSVDVAGIKAIKIKLVGTLAIKGELDFEQSCYLVLMLYVKPTTLM